MQNLFNEKGYFLTLNVGRSLIWQIKANTNMNTKILRGKMTRGKPNNGKRRSPQEYNMNEILVEVNGKRKKYVFTEEKIKEAIANMKEETEYSKNYHGIYVSDPRNDKNGKKYGMMNVVRKMVEIQEGELKKFKFDHDGAKRRFNNLNIKVKFDENILK